MCPTLHRVCNKKVIAHISVVLDMFLFLGLAHSALVMFPGASGTPGRTVLAEISGVGVFSLQPGWIGAHIGKVNRREVSKQERIFGGKRGWTTTIGRHQRTKIRVRTRSRRRNN